MKEQFLESFKYHLLRLLDSGSLVHVNSLFIGYNCSEQDIAPSDNNWRKRIICNTPDEVYSALKNPPIEHKQQLYILYPLDYKLLNLQTHD